MCLRRRGPLRIGVEVVAALFFASGIAFGQGLPNGSITGSVTSAADGQPLPGVTVTTRSPALQGTRNAVSTVNGDFIIPNLPPGEYEVGVQLQGFQPVTQRGIPIGSSQRQDLHFSMKLEAVSANVVVTVEREQVFLTPQAATTFTAEVLDKLPVDRTLLSAVYLAPGLNQNGPKGAVTISGALSYDNLFLVNGANIMENLVSTPLNLFVEDAIQETTVTTGGISAEYGRFAGGVINTITKSGGNGFSGSVRTNFSDPAWAAVQPLGSPGLQEVDETYEATFGGPILKDKIWFFGSGRYGILDSTYTTPGTLIPVNQSNKDERYEGKLTISPIQNHTLTVSYLNWTRDQGNYFFNAAGTYDLASLYDRQIPSNITVVPEHIARDGRPGRRLEGQAARPLRLAFPRRSGKGPSARLRGPIFLRPSADMPDVRRVPRRTVASRLHAESTSTRGGSWSGSYPGPRDDVVHLQSRRPR